MPDNEPNQFFILTQEEVNTEVPLYVSRIRAERLKMGLSVEKVERFAGLLWSVAERSRDRWDKLPI